LLSLALALPLLLHQNTIHQNIYGKSLAITSTEQLSNTVIENPEMLKYQQERSAAAATAQSSAHAAAEQATPKLTSVVNGESLEDIRKVQRQSSNQSINQSRSIQSI
jgi:Mn-containing catalase